MLQNLVDSGQWTVNRKMRAEGKGVVNFRQVGNFPIKKHVPSQRNVFLYGQMKNHAIASVISLTANEKPWIKASSPSQKDSSV